MSLLRDVLTRANPQDIDVNLRLKAWAIAKNSILPVACKKMPKRRRPDVSRLGAPNWSDGDPWGILHFVGSQSALESNEIPTTAACGHSMKLNDNSCLSVILYHHGHEGSKQAEYFERTTVRGEIRMFLPKSESLSSVDVWLISYSTSFANAVSAHFHLQHANIWERSKGERFSRGVYSFPFEFEPFPEYVEVQCPTTQTLSLVPFPPSYEFHEVGGFSGSIKHQVRVKIQRASFGSQNDEFKIPIHFSPRRRPIPRRINSPPSIRSRQSWPYQRGLVGGWMVTPFGGRGRFQGEMTEIEGLLCVPSPEVYCPGETLSFSLRLWSPDANALDALSDPSSFDVMFVHADMYGPSVLHPSNASRHHRLLQRLSQGRVWRAGEAPSASEEPFRQIKGQEVVELYTKSSAGVKPHASPKARSRNLASFVRRGPHPSRFQQVYNAATHYEESQELLNTPNPSFENLDSSSQEGNSVKLEGEIRLPSHLSPSFRFSYMGREYALIIIIKHPDYVQISPATPGVVAETPIWVVSGATCEIATRIRDSVSLPISGEVIVGATPDMIRASTVRGVNIAKVTPSTSQGGLDL